MVVSWNPDIFTDDAQYSLLIELANWVQSEIYSRPQRTANNKLSEVGRCLLMHICTLLVWGIFGNMDKELLLHEERKRLLKANVSYIGYRSSIFDKCLDICRTSQFESFNCCTATSTTASSWCKDQRQERRIDKSIVGI